MKLEIKLKDIPDAFIESVFSGLKHYLVPMLGQSETPSGPNFEHFGSGTLIQIGPTTGILTAAHVWHKAKTYKQINIALTDLAATGFSILPSNFTPRQVWGGKKNQWGPDLAFLELSPKDYSTLSASKSFLNFTKQKAELADNSPETAKRLWVIMGLVAEFSTVDPKPKEGKVSSRPVCRGMFSTIHNTHERNGHDYFDAGVNQGLEGVPTTFGGVSGGGLWQVDLSKNKDGEFYWNEKPHLRGVAFWETEPVNGRRFVRHHGPKSIFETAWKEWGFPENV